MTIRVVLADDEPIIVKGLRKLVPWEALGMAIVAQAYDGLELRDAISAHKPDIVISDISMPHLTGIDILKELNDGKLPVKVIFISAYQEFSYARDAVAFGAVDYLVKPIDKHELERVLAKAASLLREEDEELKRKDRLQQMDRRRKSEEWQDGIGRLIEGALPPESLLYRKLDAELNWPLMTIAMLEAEPTDQAAKHWPGQERRLIDFAIENVLNELAAGIGFIIPRNGRFILLIGHRDREAPRRLAQEMQEKIATYLKLQVSIGIGGSVERIADLAESGRQAERALETKYFDGWNRIIPYVPHEPEPIDGSKLYERQADVVQGLVSGRWDKTAGALDLLLDQLREAAYGNRNLAVTAVFGSVLPIIQEIAKKGVPLAEGPFEIHGLQTQLDRYETFDGLRNGIHRIIGELFARLGNRAGGKDSQLLARIRQYIDEHYAEDISLESVAAIAFMNPYYFSTFFKKQMDENFKAYVTKIRMKQAVRLLEQTDLMVYEIAERVGYQNARHFSDVFKKTYGKLPMAYKQQLGK